MSATFRPKSLKAIGYADCSDAEMVLVRSLLAPQATAPLATPVATTAANFGRVPRGYITCLQDRIIGSTAQKRMYDPLPCQQVIALNTSHNPYLSDPQILAQHLLCLVTQPLS